MASLRAKLCPLLALVATELFASGSYVTRPPLPASHDSARYELGKAIALGRAPLPGVKTAPAGKLAGARQEGEAQSRRLSALQDQLPGRIRSTMTLPALAGRLTEGQLEALEYYLRVRYKIR